MFDLIEEYEHSKMGLWNFLGAKISDSIKTSLGDEKNAGMISRISKGIDQNTPVTLKPKPVDYNTPDPVTYNTSKPSPSLVDDYEEKLDLFKDTTAGDSTDGEAASDVLAAQGFNPKDTEATEAEVAPKRNYIGDALSSFANFEGLDHGPNGKLVNGRLTYNYGVEQDTLDSLKIKRSDFKDKNGVIDDLAVASEVGKYFHEGIKKKIPNWEKLPASVYNSMMSLSWNMGRSAFNSYSLGANLNKIADSKDTVEEKNKKYAQELRKNLLDSTGAKIGGSSKTQVGLANRRARDYNLAAEGIGADLITEYRVSKRGKTGSKVEYFTKESGDTPVRTVDYIKGTIPSEADMLGKKRTVG